MYTDWFTYDANGGEMQATGAPGASAGVLTPGTTWADTLKGIFATGATAYIDSQFPNPATVNDPTYNTAGGKAGRAQRVAGTSGNVALWVGLGVALVVLVYALRR